MYSRRVPEVDGQTHPPPSIKSTSAGERTQPPHSPKTHISQALCSDATTPAHIPRHAVNPSLGARVQHPCCTRSGNVCRALRCAKLEYLKDKRDKNEDEHTSELQSRGHLVCRLLLEKKKSCRFT